MMAIIRKGWPISDERVVLPIPDLLIAGRFCT